MFLPFSSCSIRAILYIFLLWNSGWWKLVGFTGVSPPRKWNGCWDLHLRDLQPWVSSGLCSFSWLCCSWDLTDTKQMYQLTLWTYDSPTLAIFFIGNIGNRATMPFSPTIQRKKLWETGNSRELDINILGFTTMRKSNLTSCPWQSTGCGWQSCGACWGSAPLRSFANFRYISWCCWQSWWQL